LTNSGVDEEVRDLGADGRVADVTSDGDDVGTGRGALIEIDADDAAVRADRVSEDREPSTGSASEVGDAGTGTHQFEARYQFFNLERGT
jgi:hypothetical protein